MRKNQSYVNHIIMYDRNLSTFQTINLGYKIFEGLKNYSHDFGVKIVTKVITGILSIFVNIHV